MSVHEIMTAAEAAEYLQVHIKTLYGWIKSGDLPVINLGPRSTRIRKSDIDQFLSARLTTGADAAAGLSAERGVAEAKFAAPSTATRDVKRKVVK
jgi:excisionase family DNA binding protein